MSGLDRMNNFRANFVDRMVGDKAECSRFQIEEQILSEDADVDLAKLAQFAFKHNVPKIHRVPVWKLLLRVSSTSPEVRKRVAEHRTQEQSDNVEEPNSEYHPTSLDIAHMVELANGFSSFMSDRHSSDLDFRARLAIARRMSLMCESNWVDAYWLTKAFDDILSHIFTPSVLPEVRVSI
ncbi:unnamed protein product [Gongylonema pulchrum]|uniref:Rab-GAP TBC domain-containing protein n=1 Tax=Gongylonema pulchrum TaxID=637853 RepID=A0A183EGL7_9BILA|nr:unnamed protein product [Gongylonema pulchrum]